MHYFKRNIGDYHKKAGRLSMIEHGAYTLLLDACYDRERFPTIEDAVEWSWARSDEEIAAVHFVLSKFFTLIDGFYVQQRVQDEIDAFRAKSMKNQEIAIAREAARRKIRERNEHETCTDDHLTINHKPLTTNHEPSKNSSPSGDVDQAFDSFWNLYPKKVSKVSARKAWKKVKPAEYQILMAGLAVQVSSHGWKKDGGQWVPNPATWLNAERWNDEVKNYDQRQKSGGSLSAVEQVRAGIAGREIERQGVEPEYSQQDFIEGEFYASR